MLLARLCVLFAFLLTTRVVFAEKAPWKLEVEQITSGPKHHFFGYIGQCQTIPWSFDGRYILAMEIDEIARMPDANEAATICLIDTENQNKILRIEKTKAWNPQQGTMFFWNPAAESQCFFNDRDDETGNVFTVLYDIEQRRRVREFRYPEAPIGNAGVAVDGSAWLGLNYGRLARLRSVTGYPESRDWSRNEKAPDDDGLFHVNIGSGSKKLLVSYRDLENQIKEHKPQLSHTGLFINHALWNRGCDRVYFFARAGWSGNGGDKINIPFSVHSDGTGLTMHEKHIGGHPEWAEGSLLIGRSGRKQIVYDIDSRRIVDTWGDETVFPNPEGDISLSADGRRFVNGYKRGDKNFYVVYRRDDGVHVRSRGIPKGTFSGDIRIDPAPRWNRSGDRILIPGLAQDGTRQMFVIRLEKIDD
ncbi:hypothetical protein OAF83_01510 [Rubripirellula sp.]|jgi:hypothetical protein|nr:hypothetical protein [Rubripirellula sp.]MDB4694955.1 hypothetical protein [bacterium]MDB4749559.1 hypothetical protein [Rubripirellula sp.]